MPFRDRTDAGLRLADALADHRGEAAVVFALPRGGAPVAAKIAERLNAPLDLVLVRKIGVPYQPELAMGAVADGGAPTIVRNEDVIALADISPGVFDAIRAREQAEIERRRALYLGGRPRPDVAGKLAIVVDDGVATGATTRAALRAVRALQSEEAAARRARRAHRGAGRLARGRRRDPLPRAISRFRRDRLLLCGFSPDRRRGGDRHSRSLHAAALERRRPDPTRGSDEPFLGSVFERHSGSHREATAFFRICAREARDARRRAQGNQGQ